jgi:prolyl-tRNA synthetase
VSSVSDVAKFLGADPRRFLKTQLYLHEGLPVMALIRGDHELNEAKLGRLLGGGALERADEEAYRRIAGCEVGFAGPRGLPRWKTPEGKMVEARIVADNAVRSVANGISGANKEGFHTLNLNYGRDFSVSEFSDLRMALPEDPCPRCGREVGFKRGIEVGHVFRLGTKYSERLDAVYLDARQEARTMVMGCYGIGVSRVVAAAIEQSHDADGILWPPAIAPYSVLIVPVENDDPAVAAEADRVYGELAAKGVEVLMDDRAERPGVRFKDGDLVGIPYRVVVSRKTLAAGEVEFKERSLADRERWKAQEAVERLLALPGVRPV